MHNKSTHGNYKSAFKEVFQQLVSLFAKNTLRMELHAFEIPLAMADTHDFTAGAAGGNDKNPREGLAGR